MPSADDSAPPSSRSFLICATPRSGSTLLCELLAQTGVAGKPNELLLLWEEHKDKEDPVFWRLCAQATLARGRSDNGVSGIKVMANSFRHGMQWLRRAPEVRELSDWQVAVRAFENPSAIRIQRRDRVRQAVSLFIANQTKVYHVAEQGHERNELLGRSLQRGSAAEQAGQRELSFHFDGIDSILRSLEAHERYWDETLANCEQPVLELIYEDFVQNQQRDIERILDHLGIAWPEGLRLESHMRKMSNERNERFVAEYRRERERRGDGTTS
ncbi:MAG: Stf0 family sulfotransferase [Planctomycetota bacterium]